jgi:hypothetical protein
MAGVSRPAVRGVGVALVALAMFGPVSAHAQAVNVFYERALMTAAGQRCRLFTAPVAAALAAGQAQARGAALRAGVDQQELARVEARARAKAGAQACGSPDLALAAGRVKGAFEGYSHLLKMGYPGEVADWNASRSLSRSGMVWNLSQTTRFGADRMTFGLAGKDGVRSLVAVVRFADGARPYAARLIVRDADRAPRPYLDRRGRTGILPLASRITPRAMTDGYLAEARFAPDPLLVDQSLEGAIGYRFPAVAAQALAALDPREAVEVEFVFSGSTKTGGRDTVRRAYVEVGDFAAGRAFLSAAG